ncbi:MAG: hypothetical protein ACKOKC_18060, partial [Chthoniobacterales bacterium]
MTKQVIKQVSPSTSLVGLFQSTKSLTAVLFVGLLASAGWASEQAPTQVAASKPPAGSAGAVADWWNGKNVSGNWFGARDVLADNGLKLDGR